MIDLINSIGLGLIQIYLLPMGFIILFLLANYFLSSYE